MMSDAVRRSARGRAKIRPDRLALDLGEVGGNYRIEFKPDAHGQQWQSLATIQLTNSPQWFIDVESTTNRSRIYRSIRQP